MAALRPHIIKTARKYIPMVFPSKPENMDAAIVENGIIVEHDRGE